MKYAIVKSRRIHEYIRPFEGCFEVVSETDNFVTVRKERNTRDGIEVEEFRVGRSNVVCFSKNDITETLKSLNKAVNDSWDKHNKLVDLSISLVKLKA